MKVIFTMEKATKNTIRFAEKLEHELDAPKIGTIYVPKATLGEIGWTEDNALEVSLERGDLIRFL